MFPVHLEVRREATARPVRRPVRRRAACGGQHPGAQPCRQLPRWPAPVTIRQTLHAVLQEPPAPLRDGRSRDVELHLHRPCGNALGEEQHDLGALDESSGQGVRAGDLLEIIALCVAHMNRLSFKGHIRRRRQPDAKRLSSTVHECPPVRSSCAVRSIGARTVHPWRQGRFAIVVLGYCCAWTSDAAH